MDGSVALSVGLFVSQCVTLVLTTKIYWIDFLAAHTNIQVAWTMAFRDVDDPVTLILYCFVIKSEFCPILWLRTRFRGFHSHYTAQEQHLYWAP